MPTAKHTRRTTQRPALPRTVPADLPGWRWAQNGAGELALVAPGGESTPWFLREAEARALVAAHSYQAERPQLRTCHEEAAAVAQTNWVARALPGTGWELHPRGRGQTRVATDDTGLRLAVARLQAGPELALRALATELTAAGAVAVLVGDDLGEAAQPLLLELPVFDQRAFQLEWGQVQQALGNIDAQATLVLLHAAQARLGEAQEEL